MTKSAMRGVPVTLQDAATTGNGTVIAIPDSFRNHKLTIKGVATVSAGAIQPETANAPDYSGTWAQVGGGPITVVSGAEIVYTWTGLIQFLRARISTTITGSGGSVTVEYEGS